MTLFGWQTTWGAFSFPFIFLATDLTVRLIGKETARRVITGAMFFALIASYLVSVLFKDGMFQGWISLHTFNLFVARISLASFFAYVFGQLLDIHVFDHLRKLKQWWWAPIASTLFGSMLDSIVFFTIAFWHSPDPFMAKNWIEIASVDYVVKLSISMVLFIPLYGLLLRALARMFQKI
ncbi:UNVERIFIED_CONTAM: hypothetical protein GTU68_008228 [Idotea baltica]|nr:hypothetical protein [Idotea baltica]